MSERRGRSPRRSRELRPPAPRRQVALWAGRRVCRPLRDVRRDRVAPRPAVADAMEDLVDLRGSQVVAVRVVNGLDATDDLEEAHGFGTRVVQIAGVELEHP